MINPVLIFLLLIRLSISEDSFLINTPTCQIPFINPFAKDAMAMFKGHKNRVCPERPQMVHLNRNNSTLQYSLQVNPTEALKLNITHPECCMKIISRKSEDNSGFSECFIFSNKIEVPQSAEFLLVLCENSTVPSTRSNYTDIFFLVQPKKEVQDRITHFNSAFEKRAPSVLIIGVDTVGRLNFQRTMPKVVDFIKKNHFYDLKGFNKIGDNTYPNLLATLAGLFPDASTCNPTIVGGLDKCAFLWKDFANYGYATAYTEDYGMVSSFNYLKKGFKDPPVDYYGRPGTLILDSWMKRKDLRWSDCHMERFIVDQIYNLGVDFAEFFKGDPYFGLFWTNSLTHNRVQGSMTMEDPLLKALNEAKTRGILADSIVILMSDHGMRFAPAINLPSGWYDVRLPFLFISLPPWFIKENPEAAAALKVNEDRLTSPFDLHLTLKHILRLSGRLPEGEDIAKHCHTAQSLFAPVPLNRTCGQACLTLQWCTCNRQQRMNKSSELVKRGAEFAVEKINEELQKGLSDLNLDPDLCVELELEDVQVAYNGSQSMIVNFRTKPGNGNFEAALEYDGDSKQFQLVGEMTRHSVYKVHSDCVRDLKLKKFCECAGEHNERDVTLRKKKKK